MLNNKQRAFLKSLANHTKATVMVGKEGISENLIESLNNSLLSHELVKVSILNSCPMTLDELKVELAYRSQSEIVQTIGKNIVLYRKNIQEPKIVLPR